ncbi:MAG: DNA polymerase I [Bacteroidia bacterium]|nr:MAG: DNA polymerase I [Bacteroidia bacterium]
MITAPVEKKIFLVDAMAIVYRSYFAFIRNPLINSKKLNTSASFGFTNSILNVLKNEQPSHIAIAFDTHAPTERHIQFKEYKAQRQETPEDIINNLPYIHQIIEGMNIHSVSLDGYEADDIIGTMAVQLSKKGFAVYIMSADKDYGQLLNDNIFLYKPGRSGDDAEIINAKKVCEKWQIQHPHQVIDILGLMGDTSDNIPGVPGIGEKTAAQLIHQFGSIENIYLNIEHVKGKLKDKLLEYKEQAFLSKQLATINTNVPVHYTTDELKVRHINKEKLLAVFKELEFKKLAVQVIEWGKEKVSAEPTLFDTTQKLPESRKNVVDIETELSDLKTIKDVRHNYYIIQSDKDERFKELLKELEQADSFAFDTETTQLNPLMADIVGMSFAIHPHTAYYIHLFNNPNAKDILNNLKPVFENKNKILIGQNIKYDYHILKNYHIEIHCQLWDTMVAHFLINPDDNKHNLNYLSETYLKYSPVKIDTLIGDKKSGQISMSLLSGTEIKDYAAEDADVALQLKHVFEKKLKETETGQVFEKIEMPLIPVLADMERTGIKLDTDFLKQLSHQMEQQIKTTEKEIYRLAGTSFNISSPKQVGEILFDHLKIAEAPKKTKTGQYATSEDILLKLQHQHPIVQAILNYRELTKLKTTYVDALPKLINPKTQRLHTTFNQTVAATGRLSSDNPNLQNIPIRSELGQQVRKAFVSSDENSILLSADYSQIELRIVASLSGDESMINAFMHNKDIHTSTAARIYNVQESEVTKEMRHKAKSVNFGIIYGQGAFGLAESLGISRTEAKNLIQNYFEKYPKIKQLMDDLIESARKNGYTTTLFGRKRWLPDIYSANANVRANAERIAINTPIQGTAADMIKIAMINIYQKFKKHRLNTKMLLQIHDELLFEVPHDELDEVKNIVETEMQNALQLKVPVVVNIGTGKNWLDAH